MIRTCLVVQALLALRLRQEYSFEVMPVHGLIVLSGPPVAGQSCGAKAIAPGARAVLLIDQAGWHMSASLVVPQSITIIALPSKCPELNPVENVWEFMRDNWLSSRVFKSYDDLFYTAPFSNKNAAASFAPTPERTASVPSAIPVTIKPYSMAVAAR